MEAAKGTQARRRGTNRGPDRRGPDRSVRSVRKPFVGRRQQLAGMLDALQDLAEGIGSLHLMVGGPRVGVRASAVGLVSAAEARHSQAGTAAPPHVIAPSFTEAPRDGLRPERLVDRLPLTVDEPRILIDAGHVRVPAKRLFDVNGGRLLDDTAGEVQR